MILRVYRLIMTIVITCMEWLPILAQLLTFSFPILPKSGPATLLLRLPLIFLQLLTSSSFLSFLFFLVFMTCFLRFLLGFFVSLVCSSGHVIVPTMVVRYIFRTVEVPVLRCSVRLMVLDVLGAMEIVAMLGRIDVMCLVTFRLLRLSLRLLRIKDIIARIIINFWFVIFISIVMIIELGVVISIMVSFIRVVVIILVFIIVKVFTMVLAVLLI